MITQADVVDARRRLAPYLRPSPLIHSNHLSQRLGMEIFLKLENLQDTGSFKIRGALHCLLSLPESVRGRGVVAASAGNHAQGVAWAARQLGVAATIFMPRLAPMAKLIATRAYGAQVITAGDTYDEAARAADGWVEEKGGTLIHAFDDPRVIAGQGIVGLELLEQIPEVQTVIVPVGGGGLIAGVALAMKAGRSEVEILGVQASSAPAAARSLEKGTRVTVAPEPTLADGISVATPGAFPLEIMHGFVDRVETVDEDAIETAVITFLERKHLVVEGAGAAPLALLLEGRTRPRGNRVVLVVSGGNLDIQWMDRIIQRGTLALGRRMRLKVVMPDRPGSLFRITEIIARHRANILQVYHDRMAPEQPVHLSRVEFDLEVEGREHGGEIIRALQEAGIQVVR